MTDRERLELAEVFASVLDSRLKSLYRELAAMVIEILDQFANDLCTIMEGQNSQAMEKFTQMRAQKEREVYEVISREKKETDRVADLLFQGLSASSTADEAKQE